ncbi:MAG: four helix bundle protein [Cyclobacteriaceae bacterium]
MATIQQFEDLEIWQKAKMVDKLVYELTCRADFSKDFELVRQIKRTVGSCMDNIAEGFERGGNKEFIQFLYISKGSIGETRSQCHRALDKNFINSSEFERLIADCTELSKRISSFINYLKKSEYKGDKFK